MSRDHLLKALNKGIRYDGRKLLDFRPVTVETGVSHSAEGSARVRIGGTEVLVGVKMALEKPYPDTPNKGNLMVNVELLPMSNPEFETGPPGIRAIEMSRVIDRGIRESHAIDQTALCIEAGEKVWSVIIDVCPVNDEGNIHDAASLGAMAAIKDAVYPSINDDGSVQYDKKTDTHVPLQKEVLEVTVYKIGNHFIVDPLIDEENLTEARLTVAVTKEGKISALQKGEDMPLSIEEIDEMAGIAMDKAKQLFSHLG